MLKSRGNRGRSRASGTAEGIGGQQRQATDSGGSDELRRQEGGAGSAAMHSDDGDGNSEGHERVVSPRHK